MSRQFVEGTPSISEPRDPPPNCSRPQPTASSSRSMAISRPSGPSRWRMRATVPAAPEGAVEVAAVGPESPAPPAPLREAPAGAARVAMGSESRFWSSADNSDPGCVDGRDDSRRSRHSRPSASQISNAVPCPTMATSRAVIDARVLTQIGWQQNPPLAVELQLEGIGQEQVLKAGILRSQRAAASRRLTAHPPIRSRGTSRGRRFPGMHGNRHARRAAVAQALAVPRGYRDSPLRVRLDDVGSDEHRLLCGDR